MNALKAGPLAHQPGTQRIKQQHQRDRAAPALAQPKHAGMLWMKPCYPVRMILSSLSFSSNLTRVATTYCRNKQRYKKIGLGLCRGVDARATLGASAN